jgi:hypothetical protein
MRLGASYNLCSKLGSKLIFSEQNFGNFSFARPFSDFVSIFLIVILFKVGLGHCSYTPPPRPRAHMLCPEQTNPYRNKEKKIY